LIFLSAQVIMPISKEGGAFMGEDADLTGHKDGDPGDAYVTQAGGESRDGESNATISRRKLLPRPYAKRRSTKEKRRDAEVRSELKARKRSWRLKKEVREREAVIKRKHPGITDESGRLTPDGKTYIKYFRAATEIMAECSSDGMDYLMRLGRLLAEFRGKTQWRERRHNWLRQFEQDIGLGHSKANNLLRVWRRFRDDLDHLRQFSRRKLVFIVGAKGLQPADMLPSELVARMRSLHANEIRMLTPDQLVTRLKGEEVPESGELGKAAPPTIIQVAPGCTISFGNDCKSLTVDWGFSDEAFQRSAAEELKHRMARILRGRQQFLAIERKKT
jgi:hypothetical protein